MGADVIDYKIIGDDMQAVVVTLDPNEAVMAEAGAMMFMEDGIEMNVSMDPSGSQNSLFGKLLSGGKRLLTGESFFITMYGNSGSKRADVAFASPYPGKIIPVNLAEIGGTIICQKDAYLCSARGIDVTIAFTKKLGAGFFGGEGFILQKLVGDGLAFLHAGGTIHKITLEAGQTLKVDTGCLVAFDPRVQYDIRFVGGVKTALFGGEGLFFAQMTGPGDVYVQSLPFSRMADRIIASAPKAGGKSRGEGSVLGKLGGLLDGDNTF